VGVRSGGLRRRRGYGESIKDLLVKLRYYASIAMDLSLYSLAFGDRDIAVEVLRIKREVDEIYRRLIAKMLVALRGYSEAPLAVGLLSVSSALDSISDASADVAALAIRGYPAHPYIKAMACQGEAVTLVESARSVEKLPARVDVLVVRRGGSYEIAPVSESILKGDLLVVRGPWDEVLQLAEALGSPTSIARCGAEIQVQAMGGDALASALLALRGTSKVMIDLAFYSLLNNDIEIAETVAEMEEYADKVYHELLELIATTSYPGGARENVSLIILSKSLEEVSDAAFRIANVVRYGEVAQVISTAVEEGEEAYVRVRFKGGSPTTLEHLDLEDRGFIPLALYKPRLRDWVTPVTPSSPIEPGDELILKYYRGGAEVERRMMEELKAIGLKPTRAERVENTS
jgi:uncharacterized protein with PhoU and TrkA domain